MRISQKTLLFEGLSLPSLLACMLLLNATSCNKSDIRPVQIATLGEAVDYAPYMVAQSKGWFDEAARKDGANGVEATTFQSLPALNEALVASRVDIAFEAEPPAIIGKVAAGVDLRIIGISCSLTQDILVRTTSKINVVADLRGRKVTVPVGTSSHYNLLAILNKAGLSEDDLQIIDMSPPDAKNAFETGQVDAWAIWPPWVEEQVVSSKGRMLPDTNARINSIMSVRGKYQDQHRELVQALFGVVMRSKLWIQDHPDEARQIVANTLKLDRPIIDLAWPKHNWSAQLDSDVIQDIQAKADFLHKRGLIPATLDVKKELIFPLQSSR